MSTGRTILALLLSLSVATLPAAAAGAGVSSKTPDRADMSIPSHGPLRHHGNLRIEVLQLRGHILFVHHIPRELCEDDSSLGAQSILFADGRSALPTSSGLTSP